MKITRLLVPALAAAAILLGGAGKSGQPFSGKLKKEDVTKVCNAVAGWQIGHFEYDKRSDLHVLGWANGVLYKGVAEWAKTSGQPEYYKFLAGIGEANKWSMLDLARRKYFADDLCIGQMYVDLYLKDNDPRQIDTLLRRALYIANNPSQAPSSKRDKNGAYERWSWCDALFMAPPVFTGLYGITGERALLDYANNEFRMVVDTLYDSGAKLFYRDDTKKALREPNGERQFWARGEGWALAGIANTLSYLPKDEPSRKLWEEVFVDLAEGILRSQQPDGSWHASMLDPESYPVPENSASALICFGYAWGMRNGLLDPKVYRKPTLRAWKSLVSHVNAEGMLGFVQPIGEAPKNITAESTEVYGPGAFLLAGSEIYRMAR